LKRLPLRSRAGDFLNASGAGSHGIAFDERRRPANVRRLQTSDQVNA
jgi:hypothetical protein